MHLGMSISRDTCPPDSNFEDALACNGLELGETIAVYLDESLDSVLKLIDTSKYDEILKYIELLNQIPLFKISVNEISDGKVYFQLNYEDYKGHCDFTAATMVIRYLWENHSTDDFYRIPGYFMKMVDEEPETDKLYLLLKAHFSIYKSGFNSNHCLIYNINEPLTYEQVMLQFQISSVNNTFTNKVKISDDLKKQYKEELKKYKIFEYAE
jgi:hypothetical protein